ncbi:Hypp2213 [Branchiostoma lanceolatum]|uniref:Hypp2213 protein n=1 Tax=Branchiostoma lanceolatum TaxID=7740 RepID=A0A8K0EM37_BRALA|nr:Hypp2213 [Branchiostoma lanceolatum]
MWPRGLAICILLAMLVLELAEAGGEGTRRSGKRKRDRQKTEKDQDTNPAELMCKMYQEERDPLVGLYIAANDSCAKYTNVLQEVVKIKPKHFRRRKDSLLINKVDMNGTDPFERLQLMLEEMGVAAKVLSILEKSSIVADDAEMKRNLGKLVESLQKRKRSLGTHLDNIVDAMEKTAAECFSFAQSLSEEEFADVQSRYKRKMKKVVRKMKRSVRRPFEKLRGKARKKFGVLHMGLLDDVTKLTHGSRGYDVTSILETFRITAREASKCYGKGVSCPKY